MTKYPCRKLTRAYNANCEYIAEQLKNPSNWMRYIRFLHTQLSTENRILTPNSLEYKKHSSEPESRNQCMRSSLNYIFNHNDEPISTSQIFTIHNLVCRGTDIPGGTLRTKNIDLSALNLIVPTYTQIHSQLEQVCYNIKQNSDDPLRAAIWAHYEIVRIQPFADFNKRTARIVMNWYLIQNDMTPILFTSHDDRYIYINAIKNAESKIGYETAFLGTGLQTQAKILQMLNQRNR